jgi:hypothetical protein
MRALTLLLVAVPSLAHADSGVSLDFGYMHSRVAVADETTVAGGVGRFAIGIAFKRHFHAGAEAEEGWLSGTTALPDGAVARTASGTTSPLEGNMLALKAFAGVHANTGVLRVAADVAGGFRDTWVSSDLGPDVAGRKNEPLLELRTRLDLWLSQTMTVGVATSADVIERRDVSVGLIFALQFAR